ncbi:hypothetical protein ABEB36_012261 [Hypothenemus hampei]|uniref:Uncharacterized protein n=1 Tax=Hypothenemus hampei TaxID=57062 RepID=A0ABD1EAN0_HYPHA
MTQDDKRFGITQYDIVDMERHTCLHWQEHLGDMSAKWANVKIKDTSFCYKNRLETVAGQLDENYIISLPT